MKPTLGEFRESCEGWTPLYCPPLVQNFTEIGQASWTLQLGFKLLSGSHCRRSDMLADLCSVLLSKWYSDVVDLYIYFITRLIAMF